MTELSEIVPLIDEKWDSDSKQMVADRSWLVEQACNRIMIMCKKNINNITNNIESWWNETSVQKARNIFISRYALSSKDWVRYWKNELIKQSKIR